MNEPVVPVPPPPEELQEVLLVDDQETVVLALIPIIDEAAERVTVGGLGGVTVTIVLWLADPPGPVHVTV
ncbi:MAG: hypothetical protein WB444_09665 [Gallionella sp.]